MTKGSPDYKKMLVSIEGARVAPSSTKGNHIGWQGPKRN